MSEYKKPTNEEEFKVNFKQKKPLMNDTQAHYESSRCLYCYDAPCMNACPTGIDIPLFFKQIHTGNTEGAAKTIYDSNWMGNACGTICPTGELCEGSCVYTNQDVPPLQIGRLQNFATRSVIDSRTHLYQPGKDNGRKVGIIGGGPAGLACACELRLMGYQVDVFEAKARASGLTVHGIAPYKISNEEVMDEIAYLEEQMNYNIKYNSPITTKEQLTALENDYDAIFIGVGLGGTASIQMDGENSENVIGAVEFIEELRLNHHKTTVADRVIVLGGGNTAMDAASESARMGAKEVTLAYRRSKDEMGGYTFEYESAVGSGVKGLFNAAPIEIVGNGKVAGVKFIKTESVNGKLTTIKDSEFTIPCEMVIKATGQAKMGELLRLIDGLELDEKTRIKVNPENNQTTNPKYFAGGDAINGGAEVVNSAYDGKLAANGIHEMLNKIN
ncbi:MAG: FAD-dependent oxidoreductase [Flavobacteriales bacterium]|nr:FAD-dependent oxidoreductase [Flavobacteriales bacterium]